MKRITKKIERKENNKQHLQNGTYQPTLKDSLQLSLLRMLSV